MIINIRKKWNLSLDVEMKNGFQLENILIAKEIDHLISLYISSGWLLSQLFYVVQQKM